MKAKAVIEYVFFKSEFNFVSSGFQPVVLCHCLEEILHIIRRINVSYVKNAVYLLLSFYTKDRMFCRILSARIFICCCHIGI